MVNGLEKKIGIKNKIHILLHIPNEAYMCDDIYQSMRFLTPHPPAIPHFTVIFNNACRYGMMCLNSWYFKHVLIL